MGQTAGSAPILTAKLRVPHALRVARAVLGDEVERHGEAVPLAGGALVVGCGRRRLRRWPWRTRSSPVESLREPARACESLREPARPTDRRELSLRFHSGARALWLTTSTRKGWCEDSHVANTKPSKKPQRPHALVWRAVSSCRKVGAGRLEGAPEVAALRLSALRRQLPDNAC